MIDKREILETASSLSLLPSVVEKDYVLGWMLAGLNAHEDLSESWVFKGGTCLKKCYFKITNSQCDSLQGRFDSPRDRPNCADRWTRWTEVWIAGPRRPPR